MINIIVYILVATVKIIQCWGSGLIVFGSSKFDEYGSGSRSIKHQIDFKTSFKSKKKLIIFKSEP